MSDYNLPDDEATLHLSNVLFLWQHCREELMNLPEDRRMELVKRLRTHSAVLVEQRKSAGAVYSFIADMLESKVQR